jgi:hypothetical protein
LTTWPDYQELAVRWRDEVANLRLHQATGQPPIDRFEQERSRLRALPPLPFDTGEIAAAVVNSHARVRFDGNRYSLPPDYVGKPVTIRAGAESVRVIHEGREIAHHQRSYAPGKRISQSEHKLQALQRRQRNRGHHLEEAFDAPGEVAREFHLKLQTRPVKTTRHLRRLLNLVRL